ncbi:unnamed protein product [Coffea canephora]|uniref:DH200=94 genomic scaffold, scaffold_2973 n=1 Tax=Coffea canephora TaxID=49390 RepID=A0A068VKD5_COFCA|nr:unnamed protein product [Coffea canephora]
MDISALASMKNVVKCDTWCELQNPANHRVFERKLRSKPLGRGHVCLGVTHRVAIPLSRGRRRLASGAPERGRPKREFSARDVTTMVVESLNSSPCRAVRLPTAIGAPTTLKRIALISTATLG